MAERRDPAAACSRRPSSTSAAVSSLIVQCESTNRLRQAALILMAGSMPLRALQPIDGVRHDDWRPGVFQHLQIVEIIANGHYFVPTKSELRGAPRQRAAFGRVRSCDIHQREVA